MRWQRAVLTGSIALVVASVVAAWIAIGQLATSTDRALERTEQSLVLVRRIAVDAATTADQFRSALTPVGDGLDSTAESLAATRAVSASVRDALSSIRFVNNVQDLRERLEAAEASLSALETDLTDAKFSIVQAQLALNTTVMSLEKIPGELDVSLAEVRANRDRIDRQILLWRLAAVATGMAILGGLLVIGSIQMRFDRALTEIEEELDEVTAGAHQHGDASSSRSLPPPAPR